MFYRNELQVESSHPTPTPNLQKTISVSLRAVVIRMNTHHIFTCDSATLLKYCCWFKTAFEMNTTDENGQNTLAYYNKPQGKLRLLVEILKRNACHT